MKPCPVCGYQDRAVQVDGSTVCDVFEIWMADQNHHRLTQTIPVLVIRAEEVSRPVPVHLPSIVLADSDELSR